MNTGIAIFAVLWIGLIICLLFFFKGAQDGDDIPHDDNPDDDNPDDEPAGIEQRIEEGRI